MKNNTDVQPAATEQIIAQDMSRLRKDAQIRLVLYSLRRTIRVYPQREEDVTAVERADASFTDESVKIVAPLIEAVDILWAILYASDGCIGHRQCAHSMEPWQRARDLLYRNEQHAEDARSQPEPQSPRDVLSPKEAQDAHLRTFGKS